MRIVFLGTPDTAVTALQAVAGAGHEIVTVVTRPDRAVGRSRTPQAPPVKRCAERYAWPVLQPTRVRHHAFVERLAAVDPHVLVVVAYGRILPPAVLELAPLGALNVHFSLLPAYRGAAPVQWALARGERATGVTTMKMNERMDEGDILLQRRVVVEEGEHAPSLQSRLAAHGAELLVETLARLEAGTIEGRAQDASQATLAPMLSREDGEVDPAWDARAIEGRIRGFDPWPGVWLSRAGRRLRILEGRVVQEAHDDRRPGTLVERSNDGVRMVCGGGSSLLLTRLQPEGRRPMGALDALNGRQIALGDRLEPCATADGAD